MVVTIIGYRGCGKSRVGSLLAARLGLSFVDTDDVIEQRAGITIREIFQEEGEAGFRSREFAVVSEYLAKDRMVISVGGGAVLNERLRELMRQAGPVVWLQASVDTITQRLTSDPATNDRRPALTSLDLRSEILLTLSKRQPLYASTASFCVITDTLDAEGVVVEIVTQLNGSPG